MKKSLALLTLIVSLLLACKNSSDIPKGNLKIKEKQDSVVGNHAGHSEHFAQVTLNNGQKWLANAETTEGLKKMSVLLQTLTNESKVENYNSLKTQLEKEFNSILQKCTMTGEAHNQLHNYLLPLKEMMEKFGSNSLEECKEASVDLKQHLQEYYNYFQ
jgi:hypothetical protein